ncbi:FHA domain-containing protein FhaB/FipA [Oerskovia flava]|uniref:FHA domain-containing protein FhaB/FipA n=1 Tax=Oerskovia flava TaxID=2986422 RepID=UPI00223EDFD0|nr:FHA domain-containing protein [Oerskovia sp. JB1-3-2]
MSELTFTLLRLGYLVLLWVFVFSAIGVLRSDLYGTRRMSRRKRGDPRPGRGSAAGAQVAGPASAPTPAQAPARTAPAAPAASSNEPTRLVVVAGALRGTTIPLSTSSILIGRAPSCTLVLDDDYSSSRHARIFPQAGAWYVEDLGSTNGTYIGEQRLSGVNQLQPGVGVRIGQSVVELQR